MSLLLSLVLPFRTSARSRAALRLEVLALRHQLQVLQRTQPRRLRLAKADSWLWSLLSRNWTGSSSAVDGKGHARVKLATYGGREARRITIRLVGVDACCEILTSLAAAHLVPRPFASLSPIR
jgi:hypothetical protein